MSLRSLPLLTCPACRSARDLSDPHDAITCGACGTRFPRLGGIPVLLPDPDQTREEWTFEAEELVADNERSRTRILAQLAGEKLSNRTRARLQSLHTHLLEHRERLLALLADAGIQPRKRTRPDRERVPGEGTVTAYYHQIHRDWGWDADGSAENRDALRAITDVVPADTRLGKTLVLGAGACRLPMDVHAHYDTELTLAVDINPVPFLVAAKMLAGETLPMFEFPISPRTSEHAAVERQLRRLGERLDGFELAFADGLDPPVREGAFDTVLTPWFIDQVPRNLLGLFPVIRRVLARGGRWINSGPLIYHPAHTMLAHRYRVDEVMEMLADAGFEVREHRHVSMPYMMSPAGTQGRTEYIFTFDARKTSLPDRTTSADDAEPGWLEREDVPIPLMPGIERYQPPHPMFAAVVSLVDGERSIRDIADILVRKHGLPADAAGPGVRACLVEIRRVLAGE